MSDSDPSHRAIRKNGRDQLQDREIAEHEDRLDKNDADHAKIMEILGEILTDIKARKLLRTIAMVVSGALLAGLGWFVIVTLQHVWSGERWGNELRHDIDQNHEAINELQEKE